MNDRTDNDTETDLAPEERALIERVRALPALGEEPDWQALERSIRLAVGDELPQPWWRRHFAWLVVPLGTACAATAAIALWLHHPAPTSEVAVQPTLHVDGPAAPKAPTPAAKDEVYLDGNVLDADDDALDSALDALDDDARTAFDTDDTAATDGILPASDLGWVDNLDDTAVARAEQWLARKKT
jgi:hypothetical protein